MKGISRISRLLNQQDREIGVSDTTTSRTKTVRCTYCGKEVNVPGYTEDYICRGCRDIVDHNTDDNLLSRYPRVIKTVDTHQKAVHHDKRKARRLKDLR